MFELSEQQRQDLSNPEPEAIDPQTQQVYVLVRQEVYEEMKALWEQTLDIREAYRLVDEMAAKAGWDDPAMDIYNDSAKMPIAFR